MATAKQTDQPWQSTQSRLGRRTRNVKQMDHNDFCTSVIFELRISFQALLSVMFVQKLSAVSTTRK